ncbi:MAG: hypothetical protein RLZZ435_963 [Cyanobacteriota bacterium]|jgi:hypothetical protein
MRHGVQPVMGHKLDNRDVGCLSTEGGRVRQEAAHTILKIFHFQGTPKWLHYSYAWGDPICGLLMVCGYR